MDHFLMEGFTDSAILARRLGVVTTLPDKRIFIDDYEHRETETLARVDAATWREAKRKLLAQNLLLEV